jgi:hypothetical protein
VVMTTGRSAIFTSGQSWEASFDEADKPVLVGVRASRENVPVSRMSTGTREQLYLALRLASLERHVELHGPMPVILDDVVLHSDPRRKSAILRALADLGRRTQVIAFTHDPQVVALAQNAVDRDLLTVHELGGNEISGVVRQVAGRDGRRPRSRLTTTRGGALWPDQTRRRGRRALQRPYKRSGPRAVTPGPR